MTSIAAASLVVLAKRPVAGRVKTRLCPPLTSEEAAALAQAALADTLIAVLQAPVARRVAVLDGEPGPWLPRGIELIMQRGDGLAERIASAFSDVGGPALLIGSDTPQVSPTLLGAAARALLSTGVDAVLGPAVDGGWWIAGLRRPTPAAFCGVAMSTDTTGSEQLARFGALGLSVATLPMLRDVDRINDARAVAIEAPETMFAATFRALTHREGMEMEPEGRSLARR